MSGMISAFAAGQFPVSTHFSMIAMIFCWKSAGIEETADEKRIPTTVTGARIGK